MKNIAIYEEDADTLERIAANLRITPPDLASMIFSDHFARTTEEESRIEAEHSSTQPDPSPLTSASAASGRLVTTKELAAHFKTSSSTITQWFHDGFIPAEVAEGSVFRFNLEKVCFALVKRAKDRQKGTAPPKPFMVPTY